MKELRPIAREDAIYLAGLFDGEGCVGVYSKAQQRGEVTRRMYLSLSISNTHRGVLEHIRERCGGVVPSAPRQRRPHKPLHRWSAQAREGAHILRCMLPFLIVKKEQAILALEFADLLKNQLTQKRPNKGTVGQPVLTPEQISHRQSLAERIKQLKVA